MDNFKKYSILYIEDDEGVRTINSRFLNRMFGKFFEAKDGEEGYELYKKYKPDIILTDIKMPKLDGISLAKKIRKEDPKTKIIISTAFSDKEYLIEAIELNLEKYIIKPLSNRNLLPALSKAIQSLEIENNFIFNLDKNFYYDNNTSLLYLNDEVLELTKKELLFLKLLILNKDRVVSYEEIERYVWDEEYMSLNSLRTTIGFLRKKIPFNCIKNISNMGYKLNLEKKYELAKEKGIKKTTLLSSTIIILIVATIISTVLIKTEYSSFKEHIKNFRNTLIDREKFSIKTSIENLKKDIEFERLSILNSKKQRIKNQSIIAYNLAQSLNNNFTNLNKERKVQIIKSAIAQIAQKKSDINYFILQKDGTLILNTDNPKNEGINYLDFEDINGVKFTNRIIQANKNVQNYVDYYWFKPYKRITYSRHIPNLDIVVGSASYLQSNKNELKKRLIKKITLQNFNQEEFLFINRINSLNDIKRSSSILIEKNMSTSKKDLAAVEQLLIKTNYQGNDFLYYDYNRKLLYGVYLKDLRYFVGIGINLSHINKIVEKERETSLNNMYSKIIKLLIIIGIMMIVFFIFSLFFTRKIESIFQEYKKSVLENEDKYHMLFNHSNDGFIICELNNKNQAYITSFNNTAAAITKYDEELINKEFFELFYDLNIFEIMKAQSFSKTVKMKTKTALIKTIEVNIVIYTTNKQKYLFASLRDITERTLLKQEKEKQEKILIQKSKMASMGEMIGNIAHQWRQPLSQISGLFFDIESAYDYKELNKKYLQKRVEEANDLLEYMSKTIDDFRHFFNPNAKKELFSIKDSVENAVKIVKSTLDYYKIDLIIEIDENLKINGYQNEYSQVIMNIITNAKDVIKEKNIKNPQIKIYTIINEKVNLCIEDNAGGIETDIIYKIFEPYFTTKYEYGTGIGLYMTKLIIEDKMNGSISVKNSNNGAIFTIET